MWIYKKNVFVILSLVHRPGRAGGGWESSSEEEQENDTPPLVIESSKESTVSVESLDSR